MEDESAPGSLNYGPGRTELRPVRMAVATAIAARANPEGDGDPNEPERQSPYSRTSSSACLRSGVVVDWLPDCGVVDPVDADDGVPPAGRGAVSAFDDQLTLAGVDDKPSLEELA